jgi:thioredoxin-dependent peroxiredoxin
MSLKIGDQVPDFTLKSQDGAEVNLYGLLAKKPVVLFFYPKDNTPGCTAEVCSFRDRYSAFQHLGAEVVGISTDTIFSHEQFANAHQLPFLLLSDESSQVRRLFGVPSTLMVLPGRVTYVIDQRGIVRSIFNSMLNIDGHINEALQTIKILDCA